MFKFKSDVQKNWRAFPGGAATGRWLLMAAVTLLGAAHGLAQSTNAPARLSYDSFRVISDRNIFNPNRYARSSGGRPRAESSRPASRVESFTLVGLMQYEKGVFAFFDGTSPNYRKTLEADGEISGFKISGLTPHELKLHSGTNEFTLRVGMQVRREDGGDWFLTEPGQTTRNRVVVSRGRTRSVQGQPTANGVEEGMMEAIMDVEPEIIVVEAEPIEGNETNGNGNGEAVPNPEAANNGNAVTDPVLLRLMQRRQELNQ
ncbi:MAG TPA: hypothetical protein VFZ59_23785 [Verrucomicrobiae bacterium]|nr:hypothetical protein [Verrucomicrobiae bacterium]